MTTSLKRALATGLLSLVLWGSILAVETVGSASSPSGFAKVALTTVVLCVLLGSVATPIVGGALTLLAARSEMGDRTRRAQVVGATAIAIALILLGLRWLPWVMDPQASEPPGM